MKKYLVFGILAAIMVLVLAVGCAGPSQSQTAAPSQTTAAKATTPAYHVVLKFATWMPAGTDHPDVNMANYLFDQIKKNTNGQIEFQMFPSNQLATQAELIDGIKSGLFDACHYLISSTPGKTPLWNVVWMPMALSDDPTIAVKTKRELSNMPVMQQELANWGAQYLWGAASGPRIIMSKKQINTMADLKGVKLRSTGSEANVLQSLGATPVSIATDGMYDAIQKGTIDGATSPYESLISYGINEVTPYAIQANLGMGAPILLISQKTFASIPANLQKIINDTAVQNEPYYGKYIQDRLDKELADAKKAGKQTFIAIAPTEQAKWNAAAQTIADQWVKDQDSKGLSGTQAYQTWKSAQEKLIAGK